MKYYIIAGEPSGDLHGSNLMKALLEKDVEANFRYFGGELMQSIGGNLSKHYSEMAFMGFLEVVMNLGKISKNFKDAKQDILAYQPDVLILIDYPGFNLRMAAWAKAQGLRVHFYISPQLWAWKANRIKKIKKYIDRMFVILPFEKQWYADRNYQVDFVGHPLLDAVANRKTNTQFLTQNELSPKPIIALLPGSRKQEISKMLPLMLRLSKEYPAYQFVIAGAPSQSQDFYKKIITKEENDTSIKIVSNQTYDLLSQATAALVTSGTATLETALFDVPQIVCYKSSAISVAIAKRIVKIKYISLVNLIMDREVVKELIQEDYNFETLKGHFDNLIQPDSIANMQSEYTSLKAMLGTAGASSRTAELIIEDLRQ